MFLHFYFYAERQAHRTAPMNENKQRAATRGPVKRFVVLVVALSSLIAFFAYFHFSIASPAFAISHEPELSGLPSPESISVAKLPVDVHGITASVDFAVIRQQREFCSDGKRVGWGNYSDAAIFGQFGSGEVGGQRQLLGTDVEPVRAMASRGLAEVAYGDVDETFNEPILPLLVSDSYGRDRNVSPQLAFGSVLGSNNELVGGVPQTKSGENQEGGEQINRIDHKPVSKFTLFFILFFICGGGALLFYSLAFDYRGWRGRLCWVLCFLFLMLGWYMFVPFGGFWAIWNLL